MSTVGAAVPAVSFDLGSIEKHLLRVQHGSRAARLIPNGHGLE
jgi:hypothetical protein